MQPMRSTLCLLPALALAFAAGACTDSPTEPIATEGATLAASASPNVAASASGGADYTLLLDLTGDGVPDPIDQTLAFNAERSVDGTVKGRILYHQSVFGETFSFHADVSCIGVYDGNRAKFGGPVTQTNDETIPIGTYIWFHIIDGGQAPPANPDFASGSGFGNEAANQAFCDSPAPPNPVFLSEVASGNLRVNG